MWSRISRAYRCRHIRTPYRALFDNDDGQLVSLDCETTSLKVRDAELLAIAAVKIDRNRIKTSKIFKTVIVPSQQPDSENICIHGLRPADVQNGLPPQEALEKLLNFIGGRTLIGYYLKYDLSVLNKYLKPILGATLPNQEIEISSLYYDWRAQLYPGAYIDLRWNTMVKRLAIPKLPRHSAVNDAVSVALMYLSLQHRKIKK